MTSLLKSSMNELSGSSSEAVSEGARRATGEMAPEEAARRDPEVVAIARRRQFSGSDKRRLLAEAERCKEAGTLGAFLRRGAVDELELGERHDAVLVERGLEGEVEAGEGLDRLSFAQQLRESSDRLIEAEAVPRLEDASVKTSSE